MGGESGLAMLTQCIMTLPLQAASAAEQQRVLETATEAVANGMAEPQSAYACLSLLCSDCCRGLALLQCKFDAALSFKESDACCLLCLAPALRKSTLPRVQ